MTETPEFREANEYLTVYSGTTLDNFLTCAFLNEDDVFFDKLKEIRHYTKCIYYAKYLDAAIFHALYVASKLNMAPLVIEGIIDNTKGFSGRLPEGDVLPVTQVWIPNSDVDWRSLDRFNHSGRNEQQFIPIDPKFIIPRLNFPLV